MESFFLIFSKAFDLFNFKFVLYGFEFSFFRFVVYGLVLYGAGLLIMSIFGGGGGKGRS